MVFTFRSELNSPKRVLSEETVKVGGTLLMVEGGLAEAREESLELRVLGGLLLIVCLSVGSESLGGGFICLLESKRSLRRCLHA